LTDSNRLVRLRAAEGLVDFKADAVRIFEMVVGLGDQYGLHAYLTALENAGLQASLEAAIRANTPGARETNEILLEVLQTAVLPAEPYVPQEHNRRAAAGRS